MSSNQGYLQFDQNKQKINFSIDYQSDDLFGGDDAAFVELPLLQSYSVRRDDCVLFLNEKAPFMILCAPKGTGKTTICRLWENDLSKRPGFISLMKYDSTISPSITNGSLSDWINAWKKTLADSILSKLTGDSDINFQDSGDMIFQAERRIDRTGNGKLFSDIAVEYFKKNTAACHGMDLAQLTNNLEGHRDKKIWFFLDEIDQYFTKDDQSIRKVAGLLIAAREISSYVRNLSIRTTLKPTVWAVLRSMIPSMATFQELIVKLEWTKEGIRSVIAKRIESYLERNDQFPGPGTMFGDSAEREDWYISKVFSSDNFDLGHGKHRKPYIALARLGIERPRWVLDLCRNVVKKRGRKGHLIEFEDIESCLFEFGGERIKDISAEYQYQCEKIRMLIYSFLNASSSYKLYDLLTLINEKVLAKETIDIVGVTSPCNAQQIANFLFEIGFIEAKKMYNNKDYEILHFKDYPDLIAPEQRIINERILTDLYWEIEPAFRNVLYLSQPSNRDATSPDKKYKRKKKRR